MTDEQKLVAFDELVIALYSETPEEQATPLVTKPVKKTIRGICTEYDLRAYYDALPDADEDEEGEEEEEDDDEDSDESEAPEGDPDDEDE